MFRTPPAGIRRRKERMYACLKEMRRECMFVYLKEKSSKESRFVCLKEMRRVYVCIPKGKRSKESGLVCLKKIRRECVFV